MRNEIHPGYRQYLKIALKWGYSCWFIFEPCNISSKRQILAADNIKLSIFNVSTCPNYAQWTARYHLSLLYIDKAHPAAWQCWRQGLCPPDECTNHSLALWIGI